MSTPKPKISDQLFEIRQTVTEAFKAVNDRLTALENQPTPMPVEQKTPHIISNFLYSELTPPEANQQIANELLAFMLKYKIIKIDSAQIFYK